MYETIMLENRMFTLKRWVVYNTRQAKWNLGFSELDDDAELVRARGLVLLHKLGNRIHYVMLVMLLSCLSGSTICFSHSMMVIEQRSTLDTYRYHLLTVPMSC